MGQTRKRLEKLTNRLHRIRQELLRIPEKKEQFEAVFAELRAGWPQALAKRAIGEITEAELEEARHELVVANRNRLEIAELEKGLGKMEQEVLAQMKPLQRKIRQEQAKERYHVLRSKLEAGNYDKHEEGTLRQLGHQLGYDREVSELLRGLERRRRRELSFAQVHGLQAQ